MGNTQQTGVKEDDHHGGSGSGSGSQLSVFLDQVLAGVAENRLAGGHDFEATTSMTRIDPLLPSARPAPFLSSFSSCSNSRYASCRAAGHLGGLGSNPSTTCCYVHQAIRSAFPLSFSLIFLPLLLLCCGICTYFSLFMQSALRENSLYYMGKSSSHGFSMQNCAGQNYDVLDKCTKDILSIIKPTEDDHNKRLHAIQEIVDSIYLVGRLGDAAVKPFGSFLSKLYAKSGDLDVSVELPSFPTSYEKKQSLLGELMRALKRRGVARDVNFIPTARVPVLQYVSKHFGISCDISIDNYPGRIKSKVLYWINTLDGRFGDMVLLVKEWAKAQNINDPKDGTLNSYSLCLLVLFHFQTCKPAILPPMNEFLDVDISAEMGPYNEKNLDEMCKESIAKFRRQDIGQRNQSSLSHLLATFFEKFCRLGAHSSDHVISTYTGRLERKQGGLYGMTKSCYFVEDPFQRPDNAARTVLRLHDIATALKNAKNMVSSNGSVDRNEFLSLLCTPEVGSKLGARATADRYATPATTLQQDRFTGFLEQGPTLAAGDVKDGGGMSMADKNKNTNYAALAGTVAGLGALGAGLYFMSKPKKTEEVVDD